MVPEDFSWLPILPGVNVGDHLHSPGGDCFASVIATGHHDEWTATVNLHRAVSHQRSATFSSKGEACAAVRKWLRAVLDAAKPNVDGGNSE